MTTTLQSARGAAAVPTLPWLRYISQAAGRNLQRNLKATTLRFPQRCTAAGAGPGHCGCHPALKIEAAEQSTAKTTVLSHRFARRVSLRILQRLKTKNIRITVKLLGMCMPRRGFLLPPQNYGTWCPGVPIVLRSTT